MWSSDLTRGLTQCLSRAFLAGVCLRTSLYTNPRDLYCDYLNNYLLVREDVRLGSFGRRERMEKRIYKKFFRRSTPLLDPAFFSFANRHDIARLARFLNKEIVIYIQAKNSVYVPFYDYRSVSSVSEADREISDLLVFKQTKTGQLFLCMTSLVQELQRMDSLFRCCLFAHDLFAFNSDVPPLPDLAANRAIALLDSLLGAPQGLQPGQLDDPGNRSIDSCLDLLAAKSLIQERWGNLVICCLVGLDQSIATWSANKKLPPAKCCFFPLLICGNLAEFSAVQGNCKVVCFFSDSEAEVLKDDYASKVLAQLRNTSGLKEGFQQSGVFLRPDGLAGRSNIASSQARKEALNKKREKTRLSRSASFQRIQDFKKLCKCDLCTSEQYNFNMSTSGPEKLVATTYTARELCQMLALDSVFSDVDEIFDRVSELSVASMDIESRTVLVDNRGPLGNNGSPVEQDFKEFDTKFLEGHVRAIQKPLMIAHVDALDDSFLLVAKDDTDEACYTMMASYWQHVEERRVACGERKALLLLPIYKVLSRYRLSYFRFARRWKHLDDARRQRSLAKCNGLKKRSRRQQRAATSTPTSPINHERSVDVGVGAELLLPLDAFVVDREEQATAGANNNNDDDDDDDDDDDEWMDSLAFEDYSLGIQEEWPESSVDVKFIKQVTSAWSRTVPGMLEKILDRLVRDYVVFSFYG